MKDQRIPYGLIRVFIISLIIIIMVFLVVANPSFHAVLKGLGSVPGARWVLEESRTYLSCGHVITKRRQFQSEYLFKQALGSGIRLPAHRGEEYFSRQTLRLSGLCRNCQTFQFLGVSEGQVVVLRGIPAQPGPVLENTGIRVDQLPEAELQDLTAGIAFRDAKEKLLLIEGLSGLVAN